MAFSVAVDRNNFRFDSTILPVLTATDIANIGKLKINDWLYTDISNGANDLVLPNRTLENCPLVLKNVLRPTWTRDSGIALTDDNDLVRTSGTGINGAVGGSTLSSLKCSIEAKITTLYTTAPSVLGVQDCLGISLQSGTLTDDYTDVLVNHSISFSDFGKATIRELGLIPSVNGTFKYELGDTALIEIDNGYCRYYLIKPNGKMILKRITRSKLTGSPKPQATIYFTGGQLDNIYTNSNTEVSTAINNYGVFTNFQNWQDPYQFNPTGDAIQMADNENEYTYSNRKKSLRSISLSMTNIVADRNEFIEFFEYHLQAKDFLFVDYARDKIDNVAEVHDEFWAKFTSPFGDVTKNSCRFANSVQILESNKNNYIPLETTEAEPPTIPEGFTMTGGSGTMTADWDASTDTESGVDHYILELS